MDDGTVVGRTIAILDTAGSRARIGLAEIVAITGIPKPTVHRLVADLVRRGALVRTERGYHVAPRVRAWTDHHLNPRALDVVMPALDDLRARCGGFAWFVDTTAQTPTQPSLVSSRGPDRALAATKWPDLTRPDALAGTAVGHALLATRPDIAERVAHATPASRITEQLARGIDRGVFFAEGGGWRCAAVHVPAGRRTTAGILGVAVLGGRIPTRELLRGTSGALTAVSPLRELPAP